MPYSRELLDVKLRELKNPQQAIWCLLWRGQLRVCPRRVDSGWILTLECKFLCSSGAYADVETGSLLCSSIFLFKNEE